MAVQKRSISIDPELLDAVLELARSRESNLSELVGRALEREVKLAGLQALVEADEREFGPVSEEVCRDIDSLWPA